jgi:hypothetical protein
MGGSKRTCTARNHDGKGRGSTKLQARALMSIETCMSSSLSVHRSHKATYVINTELGFPTHKAVKLPPNPFPNITTQNGTVVVHPCPQQKRAGPYDGCRHVVSAVQAEAVIQEAAAHIRQRDRRGGCSTLRHIGQQRRDDDSCTLLPSLGRPRKIMWFS